MKLSNGRNKKRKVTTANAYAKGRKPTAKNPSFGTMPTSESAKKDTEKSTAVINQALQAIQKAASSTGLEAILRLSAATKLATYTHYLNKNPLSPPFFLAPKNLVLNSSVCVMERVLSRLRDLSTF